MSEVSLLQESRVEPRPWLALYNVRLRLKVVTPAPEVELAVIQQRLLDELMLLILERVGPYSLGRVACTCRSWRILADHPKLWQQACTDALSPVTDLSKEALRKLLMSRYHGSWKRMFIHHPHIRYDGLYVSRNTYVQVGQVEFNVRKTVHLVAYFRYYRFFPDGSLLYRTTPQVVSKVAKAMRQKPKAAPRRDDNLYSGKYCIKAEKDVYCCVVYPNSTSTQIRSRLSIRSTHPGAHDRLDMRSIASYDRELGTSTDLASAAGDPSEEAEAGTGKEYERGLAALVFVPWEQVKTSPLNLPVEQMDFYVAG